MRREGGYIALLAVLIIGGAATAIATVLLLSGSDSSRFTLVQQQSAQARDTASGCAQEALQQIHDNPSFTGSASISIGNGSCTYNVTNPGATARNIDALATVGSITRRVEAAVTISGTTVTTTAWQEVDTGSDTPMFVQAVANSPGGSPTTVTAVYAAQTAGDTNVISVGWSNATSTISSVTDTAGNTYQVAAALTRKNTTSQVMYYAKNIVASATNTVTVTFNATTATPNLRVMEYDGLDTAAPLDTAASGTGTSTAASSGNLTTTSANEMIVSSSTASTAYTVPGTSNILRLISTAPNSLVEDRLVTATGTYAAGATLASGDWIMQSAAFKAASQ